MLTRSESKRDPGAGNFIYFSPDYTPEHKHPMKKYSTKSFFQISVLISVIFLSGTSLLDAQEYNLRPLFDEYGLTIRDQSGRGTCSVFAIVGLMEFEYAHLLGQKVNLSVEYLNWASNQVTGETEDGSFFSDALKGLLKYGICEDSLFPYYSRNYTKKVEPSAAALKDGKKRREARIDWIKQWNPNFGMSGDQILQVKAQIRAGHPVAIGFQWPKGEGDYRRVVDGIMTVPPREGVFDGHSIIMVGYQDDPKISGGGWFLFRNSHGINYGDGGYGKMPYEYLSKYANDGVTVIVTGCSKPSNNPAETKALLHLNYEQNLSSTYDEVITNYKKLDSAWPEARLLECGLTDCGKPLHLFVISADQEFDPDKIHKSGKRIVLINNGIHSGEPEGIEGSMLAADDILRNFNGLRRYLENTVICIIPVYNVDGLLYQNRWHRTNQTGPDNPGYRGNSRNLDLNRDFVKLETQNARSFVKTFIQWDPDVFLDTHTTNGSDHQYVITYLPAQHNSMPEPVGNFFADTMIPAMYAKMLTTPYEMIPYAEWDVATPEKGIANYVQTPRYSTGYAQLFHALPQMIENHCYKPYPDRVKSIYNFILKLVEFTGENSTRIGQVRAESKEKVKTQKDYALKYEIDSAHFRTVEFKGYRMGHDKSPLTGEDREIYDYKQPFTVENVPVYDNYKPTQTVTAPKYYLIPQAWGEVIERMKMNGIRMERLVKDTVLTVEVYYIDSLVWGKEHENGHLFHRQFKTRKEIQSIPYYAGEYLVPVNQESNFFIVNQLEPEGPDSYFRWNFFDPCLEDREWFSPHPVLEDKIAKYLNETPASRKMLDDAIRANPKMAEDRTAQMYFVYTQCGLANKWVNRYPVVRVMK